MTTTTQQSENYSKFLTAKDKFDKNEKARNVKHMQEKHNLLVKKLDHTFVVLREKYERNKKARVNRFENKWEDEIIEHKKIQREKRLIKLKEQEELENMCACCEQDSPIMHESVKWCGDICYSCFKNEEPFRQKQKEEDEKFNKMYKEKQEEKHIGEGVYVESDDEEEEEEEEIYPRMFDFVDLFGDSRGKKLRKQIFKTNEYKIIRPIINKIMCEMSDDGSETKCYQRDFVPYALKNGGIIEYTSRVGMEIMNGTSPYYDDL